MGLVVMEFKRGLINHYISDAAFEKHEMGVIEDFIAYFYEEIPGTGLVQAGLSNEEDPADKKILYTYKAEDIQEATWGLCVTAFNDVDRRHNELFYDIPKAWRAATRLVNRWAKERQTILPAKKKEDMAKMMDFGYSNINLTDDASLKITEYPKQYFLPNNQMDSYLTSLFEQESLKPVELSKEELEKIDAQKFFEKDATTWVFPDSSDIGQSLQSRARVSLKDKDIKDDLPEGVTHIEFPLEIPFIKEEGVKVQEEKKESLFSRLRREQKEDDPNKTYMYPPAPFPPMGVMGQQPPWNQGFQGRSGRAKPDADIDMIDFESKDRPNPFSFYNPNPFI
jgi:hypothetical protein